MTDLKGTFDVSTSGDITLHVGSGSSQTTVVMEKAATPPAAAISGHSLSDITTQLGITVELDKNHNGS